MRAEETLKADVWVQVGDSKSFWSIVKCPHLLKQHLGC